MSDSDQARNTLAPNPFTDRMDESTFGYLKPTDEQFEKMVRLRLAAKSYCDVLEAELPAGPDKTFVIRNHRTNSMWANVALTRFPNGAPRP